MAKQELWLMSKVDSYTITLEQSEEQQEVRLKFIDLEERKEYSTVVDKDELLQFAHIILELWEK